MSTEYVCIYSEAKTSSLNIQIVGIHSLIFVIRNIEILGLKVEAPVSVKNWLLIDLFGLLYQTAKHGNGC